MIRNLKRPPINLKKALPILLVADLMMALQAVFVKYAFSYFSTNFLVFFRCVVSLIILLIWLVVQKKKFSTFFHTKALKYHLIRSLAGVGAIYCLYYSVTSIPIAVATLLFFTSPIFIPIVARVWLKITLFPRLFWGIGISFFGIIFLLNPGGGLFDLMALVALFGGILGAIASVSIRCLHYTETSEKIMTYYFTISTIISGIVYFATPGAFHQVFTLQSLSLAFLAGVFATLFQTLITFSGKFGPARLLSPFLYFTFIFTVFFDIWLFNRSFSWSLFIGFLFIVLGTIIMVYLYPKDDLVFKN